MTQTTTTWQTPSGHKVCERSWQDSPTTVSTTADYKAVFGQMLAETVKDEGLPEDAYTDLVPEGVVSLELVSGGLLQAKFGESHKPMAYGVLNLGGRVLVDGEADTRHVVATFLIRPEAMASLLKVAGELHDEICNCGADHHSHEPDPKPGSGGYI